MTHKRKVYCLENLMGDMGGILEVFTVLLEWFLAPIAMHSFFM
jgi:hypothetical protein